VELQNFYPSPNIIRVIISTRIRLTENVAETRNVHKMFVGKYEGKMSFERQTYMEG